MLSLGTKADTLAALEAKLTLAKVLPQYTFSVMDWENGRVASYEEIKQYIQNTFFVEKEINLIARSSALNEDTSTSSMAGKYESVGYISNEEEFVEAVNTVISSFDDNNKKIRY